MSGRRVRLTFQPDMIQEPVIYRMGRDFAVVPNIRMADIDESIGWVVLEIDGDPAEVERALTWARSIGVRVDEPTLGDVVEG